MANSRRQMGDHEYKSHFSHESLLSDFVPVILSKSNSPHRICVVGKIGGRRSVCCHELLVKLTKVG